MCVSVYVCVFWKTENITYLNMIKTLIGKFRKMAMMCNLLDVRAACIM